MFLQLVRLKI